MTNVLSLHKEKSICAIKFTYRRTASTETAKYLAQLFTMQSFHIIPDLYHLILLQVSFESLLFRKVFEYTYLCSRLSNTPTPSVDCLVSSSSSLSSGGNPLANRSRRRASFSRSCCSYLQGEQKQKYKEFSRQTPVFTLSAFLRSKMYRLTRVKCCKG